MSVYVDKPVWPFGQMRMCHMIADTPGELLAMVEKIGVHPKWFQSRSSAPHFDICKSKRNAAIQAGAIVLNRREYVKTIRRIRSTWPKGPNGGWSFHEEFV